MTTNSSSADAVSYPFADYPAPGTVTEVADGILWASTPVPFVGLRQVNMWFVRDGAGWAQIDCGYGWPQTRDMLESIWGSALGGRRVTRLIATHFHPDHAGNMAWIAERWGGLLPLTSLGEWFAANLAVQDKYSDDMEQRAIWHRLHGLDEERQAAFMRDVVIYSDGVRLPASFKRVREHDVVTIGTDRWQVFIGQGHSPEHVSLYCAERRILIAGDQILPGITTNVSTWPMEPQADTLHAFLETGRKFLSALDADTLVLPSHRKPFLNVHGRLRELARHHADRLNLILEVSTAETSAGALLEPLFSAKLDGHQIGFAMGEVIAHLNYLVEIGRMTRVVSKTRQPDGTPDRSWRYAKVVGNPSPVAPHFK